MWRMFLMSLFLAVLFAAHPVMASEIHPTWGGVLICYDQGLTGLDMPMIMIDYQVTPAMTGPQRSEGVALTMDRFYKLSRYESPRIDALSFNYRSPRPREPT